MTLKFSSNVLLKGHFTNFIHKVKFSCGNLILKTMVFTIIGRKDLTKDTIELHHGKCRMQDTYLDISIIIY